MKYITKYTQRVLLSLAFFSFLSDADVSSASGKVSMKGLIYDSACSIATDTLDQTVNMGNTPINELLEQGVGPSVYFTIRLIDCDFGEKPNGVKGDLGITFTGPNDGNFFMLSGDANGVALNLIDEAKILVIPGKVDLLSTIPMHYANHTTSLIYQLQLVKTGHTLSPGNYQTTLNFTLDYN